jgi:hypothetical protein
MNTWIYNCLHLLLIIKEIKYLNKECFQIPSILTMENQNIKKQSDSEFVCKLLDMITVFFKLSRNTHSSLIGTN